MLATTLGATKNGIPAKLRYQFPIFVVFRFVSAVAKCLAPCPRRDARDDNRKRRETG